MSNITNFDLISFLLGILGALGSIGSIYGAYRLIRKKNYVQLCVCKTNNFEIIKNIDPTSSSLLLDKKIRIYYNKTLIKRLTTTTLWFWNAGNFILREKDIANNNPLQIKIIKIRRYPEDDPKILDFRLLKANPCTSHFNIKTSEDASCLLLEFPYLKRNQGCVLEFQHTGFQHDVAVVQGEVLAPSKPSINKSLIPDFHLAYNDRKTRILQNFSPTTFMLAFFLTVLTAMLLSGYFETLPIWMQLVFLVALFITFFFITVRIRAQWFLPYPVELKLTLDTNSLFSDIMIELKEKILNKLVNFH